MTVRYITPPDTDVLLSGDGCLFSGDAAMFHQTEQTSSPVSDWSWRLLSQPSVVENTVGWPTYRWMPDGHISTLRVTTSLIGRIKCKMSRATSLGSHSTPTTRATEPRAPPHCRRTPASCCPAPTYWAAPPVRTGGSIASLVVALSVCQVCVSLHCGAF